MTAFRAPAASNACPTGKIAYTSRRDAQAACLRARKQGEHCRPYRCIRGCPEGIWHLGHVPTAVIQGECSATEHYSAPRDIA